MNFLPGTASLVEELDKKLVVVLRDGRKFIGVLRSFDQFANVVLENTVERTYCGDCFGDKHVGLFLIRGENVVLLGEIDEEEEATQTKLRRVSYEEIQKAASEEKKQKEETERLKKKIGYHIDLMGLDEGY